jgi:hypothetical protein
MDPEFIASHTTGVLRNREESCKSFLGRATHIALQGLGLSSLKGIEAATACRNLYAFDNRLASLGGLSRLRKLVSAYMEGNEITSLLELAAPAPAAAASTSSTAAPGSSGEGGEPSFSPLERLFLRGNRISRIHAGAARALPHLEELHLSGQRLSPGVPCLALEPAALRAWAGCLRVLDVSNCGLPSLRHLATLGSLRELHAAGNPVEDILDATDTLRGLPRLTVLTVKGCAFTLPGAEGRPQGRYRDALVAASSPALHTLDGVEVTQAHRQFILVKMQRSYTRTAGLAAAAYRLARHSGSNAASPEGPMASVPQGTGWEEAPVEEEEAGAGVGGGAGAAEGGGADAEDADGGPREPAAEAGGDGSAGAGSLGETLTAEDRAAVRRASLAGDGAAAPPLPPPPLPPLHPSTTSLGEGAGSRRAPVPKVGGLEGFASTINLPSNVYNGPFEAPAPRKDPEDLACGSRWIGGWASAPDRERARMARETEKEMAEIARRRGKLEKRGKPHAPK